MKMLKKLVVIFFMSIVFVSDLSSRSFVKIIFPGVKPLLPGLLQLINEEKKRIDFAMFTLLHPEIVKALKMASLRHVKVLGIVDKNTVEILGKHLLIPSKQSKDFKNLYGFMKMCNVAIYAEHGQSMHNKIFCFKQNAKTRGPIVVTGSANSTVSGLDAVCDGTVQKKYSHNPENLVILSGYKKIYEQCRNEVDFLIRQSRKKNK